MTELDRLRKLDAAVKRWCDVGADDGADDQATHRLWLAYSEHEDREYIAKCAAEREAAAEQVGIDVLWNAGLL